MSYQRVTGHLPGASARNGLPDIGGYTYRGRQPWTGDEEATTQRKRQAALAAAQRVRNGEPVPCGTEAGYAAHRRRREDPCQDCRIANADASRAKRHAKAAERRAG